MFLFFSTGGGPLTWISIGLFVLSNLGVLNTLDGAGVLTIIAGIVLSAIAFGAYAATRQRSVRSVADDALRQVSALLPPYIRDYIYSENDFAGNRRRRRDAGGGNRRQAREGQGSSNWEEITTLVRQTPIEAFCDNIEILKTSELKERLRNRGVDFSRTCVERSDLVRLLRKQQRGTTDSCIICFENYENGDVLRVLRGCGHTFHLECIDRWAYIAAEKRTGAQCPFCKTPFE